MTDARRTASGDELTVGDLARRPCRWPGCTEVIEWNGRGRPPSWCGKVIAGVRHTAVNAHRSNIASSIAITSPPDDTADGAGTAGDRPVTRAQGELARVADTAIVALERWRAETSNHELRIRALVDTALAALGDLDRPAIDLEVATGRRVAAALVDAAEQTRDDALAARATAEQDRQTADEAAEEAILEADRARLEADVAIEVRVAAEEAAAAAAAASEALTEQLNAIQTQRDRETVKLQDAIAARAAAVGEQELVRRALDDARSERTKAVTERDQDRQAAHEQVQLLRMEYTQLVEALRTQIAGNQVQPDSVPAGDPADQTGGKKRSTRQSPRRAD